MEGFMILGWDLILSGWRWLYESQVGVSTTCGAVSTRGSPFPRFVGVVDAWKDP